MQSEEDWDDGDDWDDDDYDDSDTSSILDMDLDTKLKLSLIHISEPTRPY